MKHFRDKILKRLSKNQKPVSIQRLASDLKVSRADRQAFLRDVDYLVSTGEMVLTKKGYRRGYGAKPARRPGGQPTALAVLLSLSPGFGFAQLEEDGRDCFIPGRYLNGALPGDEVLVRLDEEDEKGLSGQVLRIENAHDHTYVGTLLSEVDKNGQINCYVQADRHFRFLIPVKYRDRMAAVAGDKVRFSVSFKANGELTAKVLTVYGRADSAQVCADAIIDDAGMPVEFSAAALRLAEKLAETGIQEKNLEGREDLRDRLVFTIDGRDAKDLDDAISLWEEDGLRILGVHIADVSHYVRPHSALDKEALDRGTSVYFADRVIPMLPPALSNGICSLNPGEDRLTLSAFIGYDQQGQCQSFRLAKTVIRSRIRGVYSEVNALFSGEVDAQIWDKYKEAADTLKEMRELANQLKQAMARRGTLDFNSFEASFVLDEQGRPIDIIPRVIGEAEELIEQFMIAANQQVALLARQQGLPLVYRVHDHPDEERMAELLELAGRLGFSVPASKNGEVSLHTLRKLVQQAEGTPYERLIAEKLLRSMAKAKYSPQPLGHYGLALKDYCHFTSPIRRYPDLAVHRILSAWLEAGRTVDESLYKRFEAFTARAAEQSSFCELRAMRAERDCEACYKAEYMASRIGENYSGVVSGVTEYGVYVQLPNTVEGFVPLEDLIQRHGNLYYDGTAALVNASGKVVCTIGDKLEIVVASAEVSTGRIWFSLQSEEDM